MGSFKVGDRVVIVNEDSNFCGLLGTVVEICGPDKIFDYRVDTDNLKGNPTSFSTWELRLHFKENDYADA